MTLGVLHVHAGNLYGGVETILVNLARHAGAAPDVEPRFALCFDGRLKAELRAAGARLDSLGDTRISRPWTVARARRRLRAILAESPDVGVVVCHSAWSQAIFGPVIRAARVPSVFWLHGAAAGPGWLELWARGARPDHAVCASRFVASTLPRLYAGLPHTVIYAPLGPPAAGAAERRMATRLALGAAGAEVVILQASRMERGKGHRVLLAALAALKAAPNWVCWIAGGPQRRTELGLERGLRGEVQRLGLGDRVRFLGARADLPDLLAAADVFCQPSTEPEGLGLVVVEALYAGLPVVVSRAGGAAEIADSSCAVLVPPADAPALAAALRRLALDPGERARLAAGGAARAASCCDPKRQVRKLAELFRDVARAGRQAA